MLCKLVKYSKSLRNNNKSVPPGPYTSWYPDAGPPLVCINPLRPCLWHQLYSDNLYKQPFFAQKQCVAVVARSYFFLPKSAHGKPLLPTNRMWHLMPLVAQTIIYILPQSPWWRRWIPCHIVPRNNGTLLNLKWYSTRIYPDTFVRVRPVAPAHPQRSYTSFVWCIRSRIYFQ